MYIQQSKMDYTECVGRKSSSRVCADNSNSSLLQPVACYWCVVLLRLRMLASDSSCGPVVRTRGLLFVRPEKSWRPIVSISVVDNDHDHGLPHEVTLGCDGQNPNLKSVIPV